MFMSRTLRLNRFICETLFVCENSCYDDDDDDQVKRHFVPFRRIQMEKRTSV